MKASKLFIFAILLALGTTSYAATPNNDGPKAKTLKKFIETELKSDFSDLFDYKNQKVYIEFTVNDKGQFIVLSTSAPNKSIDQFIKERLNYKVVKTKNLTAGEPYLIKVDFVST